MIRFLFIFILLFIWINFSVEPFYCDDYTESSSIVTESIITSTFGDLRNDHFHSGIDLTKRDNSVDVLDDSEVIFYNIKRQDSIHYGGGNFVVLENSNHKLWYSYLHLVLDSFNPEKLVYKKGEILAKMGESGYSMGVHLHLEIDDIINNRKLNPLFFIQVNDTLSPRINDVYFIMKNNNRVSLQNNYQIKRGGQLFINCVDRINGSSYDLCPYKIRVYINGVEKSELIFDYMEKKGNNFVVRDNKKYTDIYPNLQVFDFYLMDFYALPGLMGLKIEVEDFSENKTVFKKTLKILLPE